jgi:signal transduction histidine kinase
VEHQIGSIAIGYRQRTGAFSTAQKRLLDGIAQHAAVVFDNIHLVEDLRQANRLKSDFLSTMSHELRTPLSAIIGYTDLFREGAFGPLSEEQKRILDVVAKKGMQLLELINTTLDLTRLEAGQAQLEITEFALADLFDEIGDDLADEVPKGVEFRWAAAPGLPILATDRGKLKTVIKNLVHNALKFTPQGSVDVRAVVAARPEAVQIVVRDTGIGIAPSSLSAIFEMFRQLEPADTRQYGGVGLGLYIVQRFLELMGGEVQVNSAPGVGSTFSVTLPVRHRARTGQSPSR